MTCFHDNTNERDDRIEEKGVDSRILKPRRQQRLKNREYDKVLNSFCRISLASSTDDLLEGVHRICDFMDECSTSRSTS